MPDEEPAAYMVDRKSGKVLNAHRLVPKIGADFALSEVYSVLSSAFSTERVARSPAFPELNRRSRKGEGASDAN